MGKLLALLGAGVLALGVVGTALANHSWGSYHWSRTANPLVLSVGDNVNSTWDSYLDEAIADWDASDVLSLSKASGGTSPSTCAPTSGRIEVCNASYGATGWLGIAQIWVSSGHITQATTRVNDTYHDTAPYNTAAWRRLVMCQEVGHDFGLDHQDENNNNANLGSCMDYTNDPDGGAGGASSTDPSNEHPNQHDYEQLTTIYTHLDGSGGGGKPCRGRKCNTNAPPFSQASRAKGDVYVDDLPNGGRRITHVFWAPLS
jgi:hypothetical protein